MNTRPFTHNGITYDPPGWLPNRANFRFIALLQSGKEQRCIVVRTWQGMHKVRGVKYGEIKGWRYITTGERSRLSVPMSARSKAGQRRSARAGETAAQTITGVDQG